MKHTCRRLTTRKSFAVLWLALSFPFICRAQSGTPPRHESHLQALEWMTHGTWTVEVKTPDGKPFIIENEIRWAETGTAIHFLTRFNHEPHYYGVYLYDPQIRQIKFFYSASNGEFTAGRVDAGASEFKQSFQVSTDHGSTNYTSLIKRDGEDAYDFTVYAEGSEKPMLALHYVRK